MSSETRHQIRVALWICTQYSIARSQVHGHKLIWLTVLLHQCMLIVTKLKMLLHVFLINDWMHSEDFGVYHCTKIINHLWVIMHMTNSVGMTTKLYNTKLCLTTWEEEICHYTYITGMKKVENGNGDNELVFSCYCTYFKWYLCCWGVCMHVVLLVDDKYYLWIWLTVNTSWTGCF